MAGDSSYKPGEIVKVSGIYSVVYEDGKDTFEVTCVEGEHFPPTRNAKGAHFELKYGATHSHKHEALKETQAQA
ncbi:YjzC family protein [Caballeronia sp. GAWG1-1]|uniref:YjzC family protein n=1 Tax=Caballeronia sp. GAWG1-1 TaxID=2921742 RepID=UPI002028C87C|nr:YjzC family protein [Caballeronia sp. GAWG1-1]